MVPACVKNRGLAGSSLGKCGTLARRGVVVDDVRCGHAFSKALLRRRTLKGATPLSLSLSLSLLLLFLRRPKEDFFLLLFSLSLAESGAPKGARVRQIPLPLCERELGSWVTSGPPFGVQKRSLDKNYGERRSRGTYLLTQLCVHSAPSGHFLRFCLSFVRSSCCIFFLAWLHISCISSPSTCGTVKKTFN